MKLRLNFHQKLLLAFVVLLALVAAASIGAIRFSSDRYFSETLRERLETGRGVAMDYLERRNEQLALSVGVLVNDFGFKRAVATRDVATIGTVLSNHGNRIGADIVVLTDLDGVTISSTVPAQDESSNLISGTQGITRFGDRLYQTFVLPVEVPDHIAWVAMGFQYRLDGCSGCPCPDGARSQFPGFETSRG